MEHFKCKSVSLSSQVQNAHSHQVVIIQAGSSAHHQHNPPIAPLCSIICALYTLACNPTNSRSIQHERNRPEFRHSARLCTESFYSFRTARLPSPNPSRSHSIMNNSLGSFLSEEGIEDTSNYWIVLNLDASERKRTVISSFL